MVDGAPDALNTLNEIAAALNDDANLYNVVAGKLDASHDITLTLTGDATGEVTFLNMSDTTLTVTVADDSHTHDNRYFTETEADSRFVRTGADSTISAHNLKFDTTNTGVEWNMNTDGAYIKFLSTGDGDTDSRLEFNIRDNSNEDFRFTHTPSGQATQELLRMSPDGGSTGMKYRGYTVWTAENDGVNSGLNADLLDGYHASEFALADGSNTSYASTSSLATVATTGDYTDLVNKPSLFSGNYNDLANKPTLFSGSYTDLTNKPTIPTVPTNISAFTNDSGYITSYVNTTYTASTGLTLTGTAFSVNSDQRGAITAFGPDTNDYISVGATTIDFYLDGTLDMRLENDGDLHVDGDIVAYSTTTSDPRLKTDIQRIDNALDKVNMLNGYTFTYISDGRESAGILSTEVKEVLPSAVRTTKLPLKTDDGEEYDVVQYDQLHALLIESVKELTARVKELEDIINNRNNT